MYVHDIIIKFYEIFDQEFNVSFILEAYLIQESLSGSEQLKLTSFAIRIRKDDDKIKPLKNMLLSTNQKWMERFAAVRCRNVKRTNDEIFA